jgi:sugar lactone lactonase YvrE
MRLGVIGSDTNRGYTTGIYSLEDSANYSKISGDLRFYAYNYKLKSVVAQDTTPGEFCFSSDGTKCYVIGTVSNTAYQYTLSTPWDISTATWSLKSFSFNVPDSNVQGIYITPDGINLYFMGSTIDRIFQYILTTPWDISTARQPNVYDTSTQVASTTITGVRYGDSGTKMYVLSSTTAEVVFQYTLSTAYDITTASYASKSLTITTQDGLMTDIAFSSDGTKLYACGDTNNTIYQYTLGTAWDISTGTYASKSLSVAAQDTSIKGFVFGNNGTTGYIVATLNDRIYQYTFSTAWDISTGTYASKAVIISGQTSEAQGICFNSTGTSMYLIDDSTTQLNAIYQYNLSTAWDVSTATYASKTVTVFAQTNFYETNPTAIDISGDDKTIIFSGSTLSKVSSYRLSTAGDLSTANSYFSPLVSSQDLTMGSMVFKPDGTKVYLLGANTLSTMGVYQYSLSIPWNLSSMLYDSIKLDTTVQDTTSSSIVFNKDGTKLLLTGSTNDKIYQYNLTTPWNISTASYIRWIEIPTTTISNESLVRGLAISDDNSKIYVVGESADTIYQYDITF